MSEAEKELGISNSNISRAIKTGGRTKNYQWRYTFSSSLPPYKKNVGETGKHGGKAVIQYDMNMKPIKIFSSASEASRQTGISDSSISQVCHKKRKTAGGFIWRFQKGDGNK